MRVALLQGMEKSVLQNDHFDPSVRNSYQTWLPKTHPELQEILEPFQSSKIPDPQLPIICYLSGGFFSPHHDATMEHMIKGHRWRTILICLHQADEGGETNFPNLRKSFRLETGDALMFENYCPKRLIPSSDSLHEGLIVEKGEKWVMNLFFSI